MPCSTQGAITRLSINGFQMPFVKIDDGTTRNLTDDNPEIITGLMDPIKERVSLGIVDIVLRVRLDPTPLDLTNLWPLMGFAYAAPNATLIENLGTAFSVVLDRSAKVHTYATCYISKWTLAGQTGTKPLSLDLEILGTTFSEGTSFGSPTALQVDAPYPFTAGVLTLQSATRVFDRFALTSNHHVQKQFENSLTVNCMDMTRREVTLATSVGYVAANTDLHTTPQSAATGDAATLVFTRGGQSTSFSFTNVKSIARPASIPGKVAIRLPLFYRIYRTIAAQAYAVSHDDLV